MVVICCVALPIFEAAAELLLLGVAASVYFVFQYFSAFCRWKVWDENIGGEYRISRTELSKNSKGAPARTGKPPGLSAAKHPECPAPAGAGSQSATSGHG
jgi:hypothetical protein